MPRRAIAASVCALALACSRAVSPDGVRVTIQGTTVQAELVRTPDARARGLSGRDGLAPDRAMLFLFATREHHGFWMQGMRFDLDLVWIAGDRVVDVSHRASHLEPERILAPRAPADRVLEVVAGTALARGWGPGDRVEFEPALPPGAP
jgi:uncharacterized membrane protein (UPF0127 family)